MPPNPLQHLQTLLLSLCDGPGLLEGFAVLWLGPEYRPVGFAFAGAVAAAIADALVRLGHAREQTWWNALVQSYPLNRGEILRVQEHFLGPPVVHSVFDSKDPWIAMDFDPSWTKWYSMNKKPWTEVVAALRDAALQISQIHDREMLRRDPKPENVIWDGGSYRVL